MKRFSLAIAMLFAACSMVDFSPAAEKKPLKDVDSDSFTSDTQASPKGAGDKHLALVWWIPNEYWESIFSRDANVSDAERDALLKSMSGISLLAVVQADISDLGAFRFYSKNEIENNMAISYTGADGQKQKLAPLAQIDPDLETVLGVFKPILGAAMGNLGANMHFYVLSDKSAASARIVDPYLEGKLNVDLKKRDRSPLEATIAMPLNALFVPRKCPNGQDAHISWKYCPWTGERLAD
jgi:hypothetical protein